MQEIKLNAKKRDVFGKKVKLLRKDGLVPANVYGKKTKSIGLVLEKGEFEKVFKEAGETSVVKLLIDGDKEDRPILFQNIQRSPTTEQPLHVDLRQIVLTEKVTAQIPVEIVGESPAVEQKLGILIQTVSEIEVEALPMDLPEKFVVDVAKLENVGNEATVKDLSFDKSKIEIHAEEEVVLAKIEPLAAEEVAPPVEEVAEGEEAAVEGEKPAEGEASTEGETKETAEEEKSE
jgi:large subunit ribosomal protein L25